MLTRFLDEIHVLFLVVTEKKKTTGLLLVAFMFHQLNLWNCFFFDEVL